MKSSTPDPATGDRWLEWYREVQNGNEETEERLLGELRPFFREVLQIRSRGQAFGAWDNSDVAQECCVKLFSLPAEQEFRGTTGQEFLAWLRKIAHRKSLDAVRKENTQKRGGGQSTIPLQGDSGGGEALAADTSTPSKQLVRLEDQHELEAAIERLPADYQQVIRLRVFEKLTYAEIAKRLGRTEDGVKQLFHRALKRLSKEREDRLS